MNKLITFVTVALISAVVLSFGCSDDSSVGVANEIPDVSGNYIVKETNCPFAMENTAFSISQEPQNKQQLSVSMNKEADSTVPPPDFYEVQGLSESAPKGATVINASVSAAGELATDVEFGEQKYHCTGTFKKVDDKKLTNFDCASALAAPCSFSAVESPGAEGGLFPEENPDGGAVQLAKCSGEGEQLISYYLQAKTDALNKICAGPDLPITFADANLQKAVKASTGSVSRTTVKFKDVKHLTHLNAVLGKISHLGGIEFLVDLERASFNNLGSDKSDYNDLQSAELLHLSLLPKLKTVSLKNNPGIAGLEYLQNKQWPQDSMLLIFGTRVLKDYQDDAQNKEAIKSQFDALNNNGACIVKDDTQPDKVVMPASCYGREGGW